MIELCALFIRKKCHGLVQLWKHTAAVHPSAMASSRPATRPRSSRDEAFIWRSSTAAWGRVQQQQVASKGGGCRKEKERSSGCAHGASSVQKPSSSSKLAQKRGEARPTELKATSTLDSIRRRGGADEEHTTQCRRKKNSLFMLEKGGVPAEARGKRSSKHHGPDLVHCSIQQLTAREEKC
ncbi:hypothetical protein VIGAN_07148700 [Vigna angularis var. angularis]|uniref:Uncharacterized protein n=1 Tax=Vigna angularis var. angularis TaxID=157739 RepID=A0A0S3SIR6_PHAAN|nr:hypothetical protein VIGAN_07148700 [Vigna angularis var. angularis]